MAQATKSRQKKVTAPVIKAEVSQDDLLKEIEKLKSQLNELTSEKDTNEEVGEIRPDEYISVISLCPSMLNLSTRMGGKGKLFTFREFGERKRILYSDLIEVMENHGGEFTNFLAEGYYYITDKRVVRRHGLDDLYATLLDKATMEKILKANSSDTMTLFESGTKAQQKHICEIIVDKMLAGEEVDLNLIDSLSRSSGIKVVERVEAIKAQQEAMK